MRNKKARNELLFVMALAGLGFGGLCQGFTRLSPANRQVASEAAVSINSYDRLQCMSEEDYRRVAELLRIDVPPFADSCTHAQHGKLSKLFRLANSLRFHFPANWAPTLHDDLRDPVSYLDRMSEKVDFDLSQATSVAYNRPLEKKIYLGGMFLTQDPLEAISVLMHEARHSSSQDPGHTECRLGDIPKTSGGCDAVFSTSERDAGAYGYGTAFYAALGLFAEGLSKADQEQMLSQAMGTVGTRFNRLPPELAAHHDLIALLDENRQVQLLSPFGGGTVPLPLTFLQAGETVERIELNVRNNGLLLFTSLGLISSWSPREGFRPLYKGTLDPQQQVLDANRIRIPFDDYSYFNFLLPGNDLRYIKFGAAEGKYILARYPMQSTLPRLNRAPPQIRRFFMALHGGSFFLDNQGRFSLGARYGSDPAFDDRADLNIAGRSWQFGNGGVMFETLYALDDQARLQKAQVSLAPTELDEIPEEIVSWSPSSFQAPGASKFQEGLYFRALLDGTGALQFQTVNGAANFSYALPPGQRIRDFVIFRTHSVTEEFIPTAATEGDCTLRDAVREPWYGHTIGLDSAGHLADGCLTLGRNVYRSLRLLPATESAAVSARASGEPARLELINEAGESEILRPYWTR